jgi:hypothetical protein
MYLRRFASYGIIVLMMRRISATLIKVSLKLVYTISTFSFSKLNQIYLFILDNSRGPVRTISY